jgi:sulfoxide reductase catalytic subunit YedY
MGLRERVTPFEPKRTHADDRIRLSAWLPPQWGVTPHIRLGTRWFNVLWILPLAFLFLLIGVAVAQELHQIPAMQAFFARYPGHTDSPVEWHGFPLSLRLMHFFNLFLMFLIT